MASTIVAVPPSSAGSRLGNLRKVPERMSSRFFRQPKDDSEQHGHGSQEHSSGLRHIRRPTEITIRGQALSPLRRQTSRPVLSRTFVPRIFPVEILDAPRLTHPRLQLILNVNAPLFIGGATVEGEVHALIDPHLAKARHRRVKPLSIQQITVSVAGIEHCKRRHDMFRALTMNLLGALDGNVCTTSTVPFCIDLPVNMGPPPYRTKKAGVRYLLSVLAVAEIGDKAVFVRESKEINVLTIHNPEKALVNSANPLIAEDELKIERQNIWLKAGIHRQTWISGYPLFVDIHVQNATTKSLKRVELLLEKVTIFYLTSTPTPDVGSTDVIRVPDQMSKEVISRTAMFHGVDAILPMSELFRTVQMYIPSNIVSVESARSFAIRFFLNVHVVATFKKEIRVQLPVSIIHPNTIDIPPNAVAQVTESVIHRQIRRRSSTASSSRFRYRPGHAFQAARQQSFLQLRQDAIGSSDMESLTRALESSPRRFLASGARGSTSFETLRQPAVPSQDAKMKITRRQSLATVKTNRHSKHSTHSQTPALKHRASEPQVSIRRVSADSGKPSSNVNPSSAVSSSDHSRTVSFDDQIHPNHFPQPPSHQRPSNTAQTEAPSKDRRSSTLEQSVVRHLRTPSDSTNFSQPRWVPKMHYRRTSGASGKMDEKNEDSDPVRDDEESDENAGPATCHAEPAMPLQLV